ncbi:hypothetical protein BC941DRAFT_232418 [Chlamydoabsidia padenii]|nr:hypothetical protein BC941DRAFT_232418 [Chlamydoabsidia padenii]
MYITCLKMGSIFLFFLSFLIKMNFCCCCCSNQVETEGGMIQTRRTSTFYEYNKNPPPTPGASSSSSSWLQHKEQLIKKYGATNKIVDNLS